MSPTTSADPGPASAPASGKAWFVTGAGRGIGRAIAVAALRRGDRAAATARDPRALDSLVAEFGDAVVPLRLDVTDADAARAAVAEAHARLGRLDVVVNNAGYGLFGYVEELDPQQLRDQLDVNLFGALHVTQAALPFLREQRTGHVVQISSSSGLAAWPALGGYHASKWALEGLSDALAQEVARFGIAVTLVEPGPVDTAWRGASAVRARELPAYDDARAAAWHPAGSTAPEAVADVVLAVVDHPEPPLRILVGDLAADAVLPITQARLDAWRAWEALGRSADHPPEG
ncbi:SDR family NAD(P)-dependent oxidoreductase [Xylanimonas protaetiae]|uniref:SDR family NAD(P)-dependent oxidoreductase n=1 Tax=Xylanimonas protaetiae TaxID=2509457 RepID=A0A4P6F5W8_9MICO|nr:SDR family NAD(P)-dependent oxidoreductase [Xylanimonas protaetiae]QAY69669.1 SDR family NAD(P)-dependent oxidoreductase [Xylanimonas protaetiae]